MLNSKQKKALIKKVQVHDSDTGSPQVQIALLTQRIHSLADHLKLHKKDIHSRRGLIRMVDRRRKLLRDLKKSNEESYNELIRALGLKK